MKRPNLLRRSLARLGKGQSMFEFLIIAPVAMILLFLAIQFAFIGAYLIALGQLNYQVTRWATNPANNSTNLSNSPQCGDVQDLIAGSSVTPFSAADGIADGYIGKVVDEKGGVTCSTSPPATGGIGVSMLCTPAPVGSAPATATYDAANCNGLRSPGTGVQITLIMDTSSVIFLSTSRTNPSFFGIPFPKTLSSTQVLLTQ